MSLDFSHDYSNHELLSNKNRYSELYKLQSVTAENVNTGDLLLIKTACDKYGLFIAVAPSEEDGTLHLSKFTAVDFTKDTPTIYTEADSDGIINSCRCNTCNHS